jgi:hypothetical protein
MEKDKKLYKVGMFVQADVSKSGGPDRLKVGLFYKIENILSGNYNRSKFTIIVSGDGAPNSPTKIGYDPEYFHDPIEANEKTITILYGK